MDIIIILMIIILCPVAYVFVIYVDALNNYDEEIELIEFLVLIALELINNSLTQ